jgi:hypothetical protein
VPSTQQARLQRGGHVADLVEEQRAAVRLFETATSLRVGAGERALLVSEQLGFEQLRRNRRRVERDEWLALPRAVLVQRAGHQLLAGARFAGDEYRHARTRETSDRAKHLLHRRRLAQQLGDLRRLRRRILAAARGLTRTAHQLDGLVDVERLRQILEGAAFIRRHRARQIRMRGHHDDRQRGMSGAHFAQQIYAGSARHADVGEQHVGRIRAQRAERWLGGVEGARHHAAGAQRPFQHPADRGVVFNQPHTQCGLIGRRQGGVMQIRGIDAHAFSGRGSRMVNTVRPGLLSNSMRPP